MSSVSRSGPSRAKPAHQRSQTWVQPGLTRTAAAQLPPLDRPVPSCWDHVKALVQGAEEEELGPAEGADQQGETATRTADIPTPAQNVCLAT